MGAAVGGAGAGGEAAEEKSISSAGTLVEGRGEEVGGGKGGAGDLAAADPKSWSSETDWLTGGCGCFALFAFAHMSTILRHSSVLSFSSAIQRPVA